MKLLKVIIGILLMIGGCILMFDFLLKFLKFAIGIILFIIGLQTIFTTQIKARYKVVK